MDWGAKKTGQGNRGDHERERNLGRKRVVRTRKTTGYKNDKR